MRTLEYTVTIEVDEDEVSSEMDRRLAAELRAFWPDTQQYLAARLGDRIEDLAGVASVQIEYEAGGDDDD